MKKLLLSVVFVLVCGVCFGQMYDYDIPVFEGQNSTIGNAPLFIKASQNILMWSKTKCEVCGKIIYSYIPNYNVFKETDFEKISYNEVGLSPCYSQFCVCYDCRDKVNKEYYETVNAFFVKIRKKLKPEIDKLKIIKRNKKILKIEKEIELLKKKVDGLKSENK